MYDFQPGFPFRIAVALPVACSFMFLFMTAEVPAQNPDAITIGKRTTYLLEPVRADGSIDYIAAANARLSSDVNTENNAAIRMIAMSESRELRTREAMARAFGIESYPREPKIQSLIDFVNEHGMEGDSLTDEELSEQLVESTERPFSQDEFPDVVAWLKGNDAALKRLRNVMKMPRYWHPLLNEDEPLFAGVLLPLAQSHREFARVLCADAMHAIHEGEFERARADMLAVRRLANLGLQSETLVEMLVSFAIANMASEVELAYCRHAREMMSDDIDSYRTALNRFDRESKIINRYNVCERTMYLDMFAACARDAGVGNAFLDMCEFPKEHRGGMKSIDWNRASEEFNQRVDRVVMALEIEDYQERTKAITMINDDFTQAVKDDEPEGVFGKLKTFALSRKQRAGIVARSTVQHLSASVCNVVDAEQRSQTRFQMSRIAFALESYRVRQGDYPNSLEQLAPKFLKTVPADGYRGSSQEFGYEQKGDGYLLTSVGANGHVDEIESAEPDDIRLEVNTASGDEK